MKTKLVVLVAYILMSFFADAQIIEVSSLSTNKPSTKKEAQTNQFSKIVKNTSTPKNYSIASEVKPGRKYTPQGTSNVIFYEDFEGISGTTSGGAGTYSFPNGWYLRNVDNRTPSSNVSFVNEAWERREDFGQNVLDSVAFSTSWYSQTGAADDWMWTPLILNIPANAVLKWNAKAYDPEYRDGYEVRVMTTTPTGGTGNIGNQITSSTLLFSVNAENTSWTERSVSLASYAGQNIHIGFRNNSYDKFILVIDDILVEQQVSNDLRLVSIDRLSPYTMIPMSQVEPLPFGGIIQNLSGSNSQTNVKLNVKVTLDKPGIGAMDMGTYSSMNVSSILPGVSTNFGPFMPFIAFGKGTYSFKYYPSQTESDANSLNDTLSTSLEINPNIYARDNGIVTGSLGIGAGVGGVLGTVFKINETVTLDLVQAYFLGVPAGSFFDTKLRIYGTTPEGVPNENSPIFESSIYNYFNTESSLVDFETPNLILTPGAYFFGFVEIDSTLKLARTDQIFSPNTNFVRWPTNPYGDVWAPVENFGSTFAKTFVIRPVFKCPTNIVQTENISSGVGIKTSSNNITATNMITNSKVAYLAGKSINLEPGFKVTGDSFRAEIEGCE